MSWAIVGQEPSTPKNTCDWTSRDITDLDVKIVCDHIQKYSFVDVCTVKMFDLDIKDRVCIDFHTLVFFQVTSQFTLVMSLMLQFSLTAALSSYDKSFRSSAGSHRVQESHPSSETFARMHEPTTEGVILFVLLIW